MLPAWINLTRVWYSKHSSMGMLHHSYLVVGGRLVLLMSFTLWSLACALVPSEPQSCWPTSCTQLGYWLGRHNVVSFLLFTQFCHSGFLLLMELMTSGMYLSVFGWSCTGRHLDNSLVQICYSRTSFRSPKSNKIPWKSMRLCLPIWAIVASSFKYLQELGSSKKLPCLNMFTFSNIGGALAEGS